MVWCTLVYLDHFLESLGSYCFFHHHLTIALLRYNDYVWRWMLTFKGKWWSLHLVIIANTFNCNLHWILVSTSIKKEQSKRNFTFQDISRKTNHQLSKVCFINNSEKYPLHHTSSYYCRYFVEQCFGDFHKQPKTDNLLNI